MNWFAKKVVDKGGGKDLKNQDNSSSYTSKDSNKSRKLFSKFCKKVKNLYQKLTSFRYDKIGGAGSRTQDDYETDIFKYSLTTVCKEIKKIIVASKRIRSDSCTEKMSDATSRCQPAGASCRGSILIEFAVCMPVLIILLFYINDLVKIKRYYSQTELVAQQFANIIQNISQKRDNKKITIRDIKYAASLAFLSIYPGKTMYTIGTSGSSHELSHAPRLNIFYIKGEPGGRASCKWLLRFLGDNASTPITLSSKSNTAGEDARSVKVPADPTTPSDIYQTLKIGETEEKIIVEVNIFNASHVMNANNYVETDKQATLAKKAFNCRLVTPKPLKTEAASTQGWYFDSVVIFTPKPGLFDPDNPPAES